MNNSTIVKIILYVIFIIILLTFMIFTLFKREFVFSFGDYDKVELHNEVYEMGDVGKLDVDLVSTDLTIKYSEDERIRIVIYGKEGRKDRYIISNENKSLKIEEKAYSSFCFGFCFYNEEVVVYLPESYNNDIDIKGTSGDINIMNDYYGKMNIQTVSGEINVLDVGDIIANSTSGDIMINNAKDVDVNSTSGEISIKSANNVKAETTSGDINIGEASLIDANSTSGEVEIGKSGNVKVSTISGDVEIVDLTVMGESSINTTSGEVVVSNVNEVYVETKTTSGDLNIANSIRTSENILKIKTMSGDISVG